MRALTALVAKFDSDGRYHPLICHMLDVAAVAEAMWDARLPGVARNQIAASLGLSEPQARTWTAFVAGLHDLGKASRPFQNRAPNHAELLAGTGLSASEMKDPGHGLVSTQALKELFVARGVPVPLAIRLAQVAGGHHGRFMLPPTTIWAEADEDRRSGAHPVWAAVRVELFDELALVLGVGAVPMGQLGNAQAMAIAGLISVADWIGSNTEYFPFANDVKDAASLAGYLEASRERARGALSRIAWTVRDPSPVDSFEELFGIPGLRPLQAAAAEFRPSETEPGLVIVESVMGEGKTEAALIYAERWREAGFPGMFIGLPTQATANQLHDRVAKYLGRRFPDELVALSLAHAGAWLKGDLARLPEFVPEHIDDGDGDREATVGAGEWFAGAKRALLAPFGVGTIDQSLFAVLQVRHVFVRLFGLAGKVVVLDEVHAYDTYMTELIERLLEWLAALGSPVILLSATLPSARRERLLQAYDRGAHAGKTSLANLEPPAYPSIVRLQDGVVTVEHPEPSPRSVRTLRLTRVPSTTPLAELLDRELGDGGCGVVICNTVGRAQELFRGLIDAFDGEVLLFHARFVAEDRQRIEAECLRRFGPGARDGGRRTVLVATQVVEQSLDLDFDVMVTEIAPVDLLLQRSGRLWRHSRPGRTGDPVLQVLWPEEADGIPAFDGGTAAVYNRHILLRTWHALGGRDRIEIPGDMPVLVDQVYAEGLSLPEDVARESGLGELWERTWAELQEEKESEANEARIRRLKPPWSSGRPDELLPDPRAEDEPGLHPALQALTRLAEPSVPVVILPPADPALTARTTPGRDEARRLVGRAVTISRRGLVQALAGSPPPDNWATHAALHRHRLLIIGNEPNREIAGYAISYSESLGLTVRSSPMRLYNMNPLN